MPWINKDMCVGCGICVENCPVGAITMDENDAVINMESCIRCGKCHRICPQNAARHDSEKIPIQIEENMEWIKELMGNYESEKEKAGFLNRITNHFNNQIKISQKTIQKIEDMQ